MKKNIAIVVSNLAGSGGERVALDQAKMFYENGNNVVLFLLENEISYTITDINFPIVPLTNKKDKYKFLGKIGYKIYAKILQNKMKKFGEFDLVLSNLPRADRTVKELNHINKYFVIHISIEAEINNFKKRRREKKLKLYKYLYSNEKIITVSKGIVQDFEKLGIYYKDAINIYNGFDFNEIRKKANEEIDLDYEYIISPSAFRNQKRYDIILDSFKKIENKKIKLVIMCNIENVLIDMIKERSLEKRVELIGFQKNPFKYMKNAKLTILASDYEGFGMVIVESLILGTPVVSTDCPIGPAEILINDLSRWLTPMNNSIRMAKKIDEAISSNIIINEKIIERFSKESVYKEYEKLCKN